MLTRFGYAYNKLRVGEDTSLMTTDWNNWNAGIHREVPGANDYNFIKIPSVLNTMYASPELIMETIAPWLQELLVQRQDKEDFLAALYPAVSGGADQVMFGDIVSTPDMIYKAYQWLRFVLAHKINLADVHTIVEFGGGYGSLALFIKRLIPGLTYYFIDTPTMGAIAYQYLQDSLPEIVNLVVPDGFTFVTGAMNIIPSQFIAQVPHDAGIFISQGALCETPDKMIDAVAEQSWFGASQGMLIIWQHEHLMSKLSEKFKVQSEPFGVWYGQNHIYFSTPVARAKRGAKQ